MAVVLATTVWATGDASTNESSRLERTTSLSSCEEQQQQQQGVPKQWASTIKEERDRPKMAFLGSGSSTGCPMGLCLLEKDNEHSPLKDYCKVSPLAIKGNPRYNKNYRNNPSFIIHHYQKETDSYKNIIIDTGKTFREGALRWFPDLNIKSIDAILLTHEHMDAAAGLDDVRGFQKFQLPREPGRPPKQIPIPVYLSAHCHGKLQGQFPWLFPKRDTPKETNKIHKLFPWIFSKKAASEEKSSPGTPVVHRHVAGLQVQIFENYQPMDIEGVQVVPLPVWHGDDLICHGFAWTVESQKGRKVHVVYLSDISRMVPETLQYIQEKLPPTDILVVDSLLWHRKHATHFSLEQAIELKEVLQPRMQTYLVGMSCDNYAPHEEMEVYLRETYGDVTMAHDGLIIDLD